MKLPIIALIIFQGALFAMNSNNSNLPEWSKKVVWYQIFPERFRNGDINNDPKVSDQIFSYPHDTTSEWQVHPWNSDWYELQPYEKSNGKDIWFNIQRRRYGGDLQGIINKLGYLKELGIGAIYLNPCFWSPSSHKYDAITYHHIDPTFGPDPEGDKKIIENENPSDSKTWQWTSADKLALKLIKEAHKIGIKIIFDGVFNHMGIGSWPFRDVVKNQEKSNYKNWFTIKSFDDNAKGTKFEYEGWFGVKELPELKEDENGIVEGPKKYIFEITKRWMQPNCSSELNEGIDGWRLDVAYCIQHNFWKDWRKHVKTLNPDAYLTAEVIDTPEKVAPYIKGDEFDAVMNYNFAFACAEFFIDDKNGITVSEFDKKLEYLRNFFPEDVAYEMQNLLDSHDTNRLLSHIKNRNKANYRNWGEYFEKSKGNNKNYNTSKPSEYEIQIQKLIALFQMTYVGAPMIYYGDEVGMWGANDPCCRKPMLWDDIKYQDEVFNPDGSKRTVPDKVKPDMNLFEYYKKLVNIRNTNIELQLGDYKTVLTDNLNKVLVFSRSYNSKTTYIVINNSDKAQHITFNVDSNATMHDLFSNLKINKKDKTIGISIPSFSGAIIK